ncbi:MAG: UDP-glucose/GDP-mannose dehydrogenase family protein [Verrucomicrobiota bacterium]|nr:UDP-glucose/GDP-mannose dehydrogenase family protein [Verrucomicrobiota bacterium]
MKIVIIGTGYVGLVTGSCFAEMGHQVFCLDIDQEKIASLERGILPIYEPGLQELVDRNKKQKRLHFTTDYAIVQQAPIAFIAVPTPASSTGRCNLSYVESVARKIGKEILAPITLVNKSTVPVGTADSVSKWVHEEIAKRGLSFRCDVVSNPEFLKEGAAVQDCLKPDRIVIGSNAAQATALLREIYAPFQINSQRMLVMDVRSAEMTKYAANAMLATRISFMNEVARVCEEVGANVNDVRRGIGSDARIGPSFLYPGVGFGGSCFPKDLQALIATAEEAGVDPLLLKATSQVNCLQKERLGEKILRYFAMKGGLAGKKIAIWGLSFKPDTDDMRDAPSLHLIQTLLAEGASLRLFDPVAIPNAQKMLAHSPSIEWCQGAQEAAKGVDAIALITEWKEFRSVDFNSISAEMRGKVLFDGRNQYSAEEMQKRGFDYISIGQQDFVSRTS